jgi:iron complex outermembrane receptor protein
LDYTVVPDTLLYVTSRRGYRQGGDSQANTPTGIVNFPFQPEYVTDYELGVKSDWKVADVPIRTNAAVYYQNYDNIQVAQLIPWPGYPAGLNITSNAAAARLWGAEFEALAQLTKDLQVGVSYDHLGFKYTSFGVGVKAVDQIAGETANRVPKKYGVNARYHLPLASDIGDLSVHANWSWQAAFGDFLGTSTIPSYALLNLSANWNGIVGSPVDVSLFASNALDKVYQTGGIGFIGFFERTYGPPRMYGIRVNYRFGADGKK